MLVKLRFSFQCAQTGKVSFSLKEKEKKPVSSTFSFHGPKERLMLFFYRENKKKKKNSKSKKVRHILVFVSMCKAK